MSLVWSPSPRVAAAFLLAAVLAATPAAAVVERELEFITSDGVVVRGAIARPDGDGAAAPPPPAVVLVHSFGGDRDTLLGLSDALVGSGLASVAVDLRGHGASRVRRTPRGETIYTFPLVPQSDFARAADDLKQLIALLEARDDVDANRLGIVGVKEGALVAARVAGRAPQIDALVLVDPTAAVTGLTGEDGLALYGARPALLICSAFPLSRERAEFLAEFGDGERRVTCVDDYDSGAALVLRGRPALAEVVSWLVERLGGAR